MIVSGTFRIAALVLNGSGGYGNSCNGNARGLKLTLIIKMQLSKLSKSVQQSKLSKCSNRNLRYQASAGEATGEVDLI